MPDVTVNIDVYCGRCGEGLCGQTEVKAASYYNSQPGFHVEPCEKCLDAAEVKGYDEGYGKGQDDAGE